MGNSKIQLFSPAKINLFFKMIGLRKDGYHNLASFFQAIDLFDTIILEIADQDTFTSNASYLQFDDKNFIFLALHKFREATGIKQPVSIQLDKQIPVGAGLGGGSGNVATMLWGLNELFAAQLNQETLRGLAAQISSDAPFFFSNGSALCEGRGEIISEKLTPQPSEKMWLVKPPFSMSTPEVYLFSKKQSEIAQDPVELVQSLYSKNPKYHNDLERAAFLIEPKLALLKDELEYQQMTSVFMTGSGSAFVCSGPKAPQLKSPVQIFPIQYINRVSNQWYSGISYATSK